MNTKDFLIDEIQNTEYSYDPYQSLRTCDEKHLPQNALEISWAIIPLPNGVADPFWIESAQNLLAAVILHYFKKGASFSETMTGILTTDIDKLIEEILSSDNAAAKMFIKQFGKLDLKILAVIATIMSNGIMVIAIEPLIGSLCDNKGEIDKSVTLMTAEGFCRAK